MHDPWIEGFAFQDAWSLISDSRYGYDEFSGVDYIWISHEHPDHFSPLVLRKIPADVRQSITILHRESKDRRVVSFCQKLGFKVQELPNRKPVELKNGVKITCGSVVSDSWSLVETPNANYFNANDCVGVRWADIAQFLGRKVDVLLTQFSYANWVGNVGENKRMAAQAAQKVDQIEEQLAAFQPQYLVPFASFVWFCRPDNFHMNSEANSIEKIYRMFEDRLETIVLYPGDTFTLGEPFDAPAAVRRYMADIARHDRPLPAEERPVSIEELEQSSTALEAALRQKNLMWMLKPLEWLGYIQPIRLYLKDIGMGLEYSMFSGIIRHHVAKKDCDLELSSFRFKNILVNGYGYNTLCVGGCYTELKDGGAARMSKHFAIFGQNAVGYTFPGMLLNWDYLRTHMTRRLG